MPRLLLTLLISIVCNLPITVWSMDYVVFRHKNQQMKVAGKVIVEAQDGGRLLQSPDGVLWSILPKDLIKVTSDEKPFKPYTKDELSKHLLGTLPKGFAVHKTKHFLICYNTPKTYAQWIGVLYERLYKGFHGYWSHSKRKIELTEPEFPLVALVFKDQKSYVNYAKDELGKSAESIVGFYSFHTNRIAMYDLTGVAVLRDGNKKRGTSSQISKILAQPQAYGYVATIIHEAVHQLAFNCGMHRRYADIPLWVSEGIAVYLETPDVKNSKGWRKIGGVNRPRLNTMRQYMKNRPANSLLSLIVDDRRFRDPAQASTAYAEAWAMNYFLLRRKPKQYQEYLKMLSEKQQFMWDKPQDRLTAFQKAFGKDTAKLDKEFIRFISKIR